MYCYFKWRTLSTCRRHRKPASRARAYLKISQSFFKTLLFSRIVRNFQLVERVYFFERAQSNQHGHRRCLHREEETNRRVVEEPVHSGGNRRDIGRECRARYAAVAFFFACRRCSFFLRRGGDRSGKTTRFLPNVRLSARFFHSLTELISLSLSLSSLCDGKYRRCARLRARDGE